MSRQSLNWDDMYRALESFRKERGHCNVCANWEKNPQLGRWVAMQRYRRKIGELSAKCVDRLSKLGFVWSPTDAVWNEMFERLLVFREKHGTCDVPSQWMEDPHLANWVANQRHRKKMGSLLPDRAKRLDDAKFVWAVYGKSKERGEVGKAAKPAPDKVEPEAEERLYLAGPGTYIQHDGSPKLPAKLERYIASHRGDFPPYIPLPRGPIVFQVGDDLSGRRRKITWSGKGALPELVHKFVEENGTLPPHG